MSKINETNYPRRTQANYADTDMLVIQAAGGNTYTTRLEDMREDYEETLAPTLSALQDDVNENLATIEAGSTASQAYAKGDFLVFGGRLCKAKTSIAVNATLVLDTNIELASVGGELSSISSDLTSLNNKFNYYNANTDRTVDANRKTALDYLLSNYGAGIYSVRYSGGYYYMYLLTETTVPTNDAFAVEFTYVGNINLFRHEAGTWSISNIV